ncbi:aspartyl-phosphate phosphatase Spo0E family protein [Metabacillus arenae]|uniref:Aspartyl-phosphate phosphatase Spo0E family protein n=1 Tax=Metabacillus arenae TaxID=2771434 RepID=A0A926RW38_9BACI|nr:aspartyl-phosphate phosphatase Spo0E family protein [Metabacillus arenae]MBD1380373.1 aspartyl-phosphate phosphatase Spo0E family protein [Metabacillus arenae]
MEKEQLMTIINEKRKLMMESAETHGLTSSEVVRCSQDLDKLLNKYQQLLLEEEQRVYGPFQEFVTKMKSWTFKDKYVLNAEK